MHTEVDKLYLNCKIFCWWHYGPTLYKTLSLYHSHNAVAAKSYCKRIIWCISIYQQ